MVGHASAMGWHEKTTPMGVCECDVYLQTVVGATGF